MKRIRTQSFFWPLIAFVLVMAVTLSYLVWKMPEVLGIKGDSSTQQTGFIVIAIGGVVFLLLMGIYYIASRQAGELSFEQLRQRIAGDDKKVEPVDVPLSESVAALADLAARLHRRYGRLWGFRVRILLVMGEVEQVEAIAPGLTAGHWLEG
nr:type VI secretion protein VasK [Photorhabdus cinerea]